MRDGEKIRTALEHLSDPELEATSVVFLQAELLLDIRELQEQHVVALGKILGVMTSIMHQGAK